jgi:hypothetical protein
MLFATQVGTNVRIAGGIINPWFWWTVKATWKGTGPPAPPIQLSDEEWEAFDRAVREQ